MKHPPQEDALNQRWHGTWSTSLTGVTSGFVGPGALIGQSRDDNTLAHAGAAGHSTGPKEMEPAGPFFSAHASMTSAKVYLLNIY